MSNVLVVFVFFVVEDEGGGGEGHYTVSHYEKDVEDYEDYTEGVYLDKNFQISLTNKRQQYKIQPKASISERKRLKIRRKVINIDFISKYPIYESSEYREDVLRHKLKINQARRINKYYHCDHGDDPPCFSEIFVCCVCVVLITSC